MLESQYAELPSLPARPPTPPHDIEDDIEGARQFLSGEIELLPTPALRLQPATSSDTPPSSSPFRSANEPGSSPNKTDSLSRPSVRFAHHDSLTESPKSSPAHYRLSQAPKSILKVSISPLPTPDEHSPETYFTNDAPPDMIKMINSLLKQLDNDSGYSRLDAYLTLTNALMDYDHIPDRELFMSRLSNFQRFIIRDTTARELDEGGDVQVAAQAVKLAALLLFDEETLPHTTQEFQSSMLDRSIAILENANRPKVLVKMCLGLLAQQDLPPSVMTSTRVDRLINALQTLDARCTGNSINITRLVIYRRLMKQSQHTMLKHMREWMQHVLHSMISDHPDTRTRAIEACQLASSLYGGSLNGTKALHDLLEVEIDVDTEQPSAYFDHFSKRLHEISRSDSMDARRIIPQIWSAVVLFHRSSKLPIHKWRRLKRWLQLLDPALLAADADLRSQAHHAWRRLVYVVRFHPLMHVKLSELVLRPIIVGFNKKGQDERSRDCRRHALEGYYNLLHYALRPGFDHAHLDFVWKEFITGPLNTMVKAGNNKAKYVVLRVLQGLLTANAGSWNPDAALENAAIQPEDLPQLDVKWIRSRLSKILSLVEETLLPLLRSQTAAHVTTAETTWSALIQCISAAGASEIRQSQEAQSAMTEIISLLGRIFTQDSEHPSPCLKLYTLHNQTLKQLGAGIVLQGLQSNHSTIARATLEYCRTISDLELQRMPAVLAAMTEATARHDLDKGVTDAVASEPQQAILPDTHEQLPGAMANTSTTNELPERPVSPILEQAHSTMRKLLKSARIRHDDSQVIFTTIPSDNVLDMAESQHLTEHQHEVRARQAPDAHAHLGVPSSPLPEALVPEAAAPIQLDFDQVPSSMGNEEADAVDETDLLDAEVEASPSVQQSARKRARQRPESPLKQMTMSEPIDLDTVTTPHKDRENVEIIDVDSPTAQLQLEADLAADLASQSSLRPEVAEDSQSMDEGVRQTSMPEPDVPRSQGTPIHHNTRKRRREQAAESEKSKKAKTAVQQSGQSSQQSEQPDSDSDVIAVAWDPVRSSQNSAQVTPQPISASQTETPPKGLSRSQQKRLRKRQNRAHGTPIVKKEALQPVVPPQIGLMDQLRSTLEGLRNTRMSKAEEREMDELLFNIRVEMHEAGRRGREQSNAE